MLNLDNLWEFSPSALRLLANEMRATAKTLDYMAAENEEHEKIVAHNEKKRKLLEGIPGDVEKRMRDGFSYESASAAVAAEHGVAIAVVDHWCEKFAKESKAEKKSQRDARILHLARLGWRNAKIAKSLNPPLSESQISRIIQKHLKGEAQKQKNPLKVVLENERRKKGAA